MRRSLPLLASLVAACAAPSAVPPAASAPAVPDAPPAIDAAPAEPPLATPSPAAAAAVARAAAAFDELQKRLGERLKAEIARAGPAAAIEVCNVEAPGIAAEVVAREGFAFGRTSDRLRSPANAPRPWVQPWLARNAGQRAGNVKPAAYDLGDRIGVVRPIGTQPLCLLCHGDPETIDPAVKAELARRYPADRATGFTEGELRGAFWAEVPKSPAP